MYRPIAAILAPLALAGCLTPYPDLTQSRSPCRADPGGWCDFVREAAAESYPYAMLSSNAYKDEDEYTALPVAFVERAVVPNDDSGFAYSLFSRHVLDANSARGPQDAWIIAFRGTEPGSFVDIFRGSLGTSQIERARVVYRHVQSMEPAVPVIVTGHSLGGALATQISIENPGVRAFVFNTSPFYRGDSMENDSDRVSVSERGEFLRLLRRYKAPPAATGLVINCAPSAGRGAKHKVRLLADCLTWIAAYEDPVAAALIEPNGVAKPEIECGPPDKPHPGPSNPHTEPCIHRPMEEQG